MSERIPRSVVTTPGGLLPGCCTFFGPWASLRENSKPHDTCAEYLESCEEAAQGCLIREWAMQKCLDWFY